jgi:precorrin-8X/cobalt-precorrin-8 methylmutase
VKIMLEDFTDIGATTSQAMEISQKSRKLVSSLIGDSSIEDKIRQRCVIATGDPSVSDLLHFNMDPISACISALTKEKTIYVDIKMVEAGVIKHGHRSPIKTFIGSGDYLAKSMGITRTSAGVLALQAEISNSIVIIGNAPSALITLCDLIRSKVVVPAVVIGVPVGFVNAAESKEQLRNLAVPSITTIGTRGGTPIAVATMNEIINIHVRSNH